MRQILSLKRLWMLLFLPAALLLTIAAVNSSAFAEWYATTVYLHLSRAINFLSSLLPISLVELLLYGLLIGAVWYLIHSIRAIIRHPGSRSYFLAKAVLTPVCGACVLYFSYVALCGVNYHRLSFAQASGLSVQASPVEHLSGLCEELVQQAVALREELPEDDSGVMRSSFADSYQAAREAQTAYSRLSLRYPTLASGYGQPKPVLASRLMSYCQITGIYIPFTCEANVNVDAPDYSIPATMCHELTHLRGYMREDEANFLAYLASMESESPEFRYSGVMLALVYTQNALYSADQNAWAEIVSGLSDGVRRDLSANSEYWKQFEGPVAEASSQVNDSYLKANRQEDGVKSYGRMVDLLLADYRQRHGLYL